MDLARITYRVHQCSKCPGNTEYYCKSCPCYLCQRCKEKHVKNVETKDHKVATYRDKFNFISKEFCVRHPSNVYIKYCETCQVPLCDSCVGHQSHRFPASVFRQSKHRILSIGEAYKTKREQHRGIIYTIRSEALFYRPFYLPQIKADFKTCRTNMSHYQSEMLRKAQKLKDLIDKMLLNGLFCDFDFIQIFFKQKIDMSRHIVGIQIYEHRYEQNASTISALQFLSSIKTAFSQMHLTLNTIQLSMPESLNKEDVMESLSAIQTERGNRPVKYEYLLKLMSGAEFFQYLTVTGVDCCFHISCVTSDRVWVSDRYNLILTNTKGVPLLRIKDSTNGLYGDCGLHTVNSETELIYIDRNYNINKLSKDMKKSTTFIKTTSSTSIPQCVYWSPSTGDLLVGMYRKVSRYNKSGQLIQTIWHDNTGWKLLYLEPKYITENNNGDVVVSDYDAVVVTEHGGRHRFSYTGDPSGSELKPLGICTDALSHILVCDKKTKSVQILDMDGQFLSFLMIRPSGIFLPMSLSYDFNTHCLLVGSGENNQVVIYRYITNKDVPRATADAMESLSEIPTTGTENLQQGNQSLLKLMSLPELPHSSTLTGVNDSFISCVTSGQVCASDADNLIMTNTTGVSRNQVEGLFSSKYVDGFQTVNIDGEHIYIDRDYSIKKASKDKKTTTTLWRKIFSKWRPWCVYWSPSTGDLLVGMYIMKSRKGKVMRYNQSGKLIQTIQHDDTGLELYKHPIFITENNNGDVVVSDMSGALVVTERGERHRFSYTGHPPGSGLHPYRICTDALSHIMVYDYKTKIVHVLNKDGQFLSHVDVQVSRIPFPYAMSYDFKTHRSRDRSRDNIAFFQRHIDRDGTMGYIIVKCISDEDSSSISSTSS